MSDRCVSSERTASIPRSKSRVIPYRNTDKPPASAAILPPILQLPSEPGLIDNIPLKEVRCADDTPLTKSRD